MPFSLRPVRFHDNVIRTGTTPACSINSSAHTKNKRSDSGATVTGAATPNICEIVVRMLGSGDTLTFSLDVRIGPIVTSCFEGLRTLNMSCGHGQSGST